MTASETGHAGSTVISLKARPFIKWAGGKTQLLPDILSRLPRVSGRYFEPFLGGGALFFELQPKRAYISDSNAELINCYKVVKLQVQALIDDLSRHVHSKTYFYRMREVDRDPEFRDWSPVQRASRFIYLNKTCFNGLYRVNSKGYFNVPFGRYKNPAIVNSPNLVACSRALRRAQIMQGGFLGIDKEIKRGDFVYFDPPYVPLNKTSNFASYTDVVFGEEQQRALSDLCRRLDKRGVKFMLSNSYTKLVLQLYKDFNYSVVEALRPINSRGNRRGKVQEIIVTNY